MAHYRKDRRRICCHYKNLRITTLFIRISSEYINKRQYKSKPAREHATSRSLLQFSLGATPQALNKPKWVFKSSHTYTKIIDGAENPSKDTPSAFHAKTAWILPLWQIRDLLALRHIKDIARNIHRKTCSTQKTLMQTVTSIILV